MVRLGLQQLRLAGKHFLVRSGWSNWWLANCLARRSVWSAVRQYRLPFGGFIAQSVCQHTHPSPAGFCAAMSSFTEQPLYDQITTAILNKEPHETLTL